MKDNNILLYVGSKNGSLGILNASSLAGDDNIRSLTLGINHFFVFFAFVTYNVGKSRYDHNETDNKNYE